MVVARHEVDAPLVRRLGVGAPAGQRERSGFARRLERDAQELTRIRRHVALPLLRSAQCVEELRVDPAEGAVRQERDRVARGRAGGEALDDGVDARHRAGLAAEVARQAPSVDSPVDRAARAA